MLFGRPDRSLDARAFRIRRCLYAGGDVACCGEPPLTPVAGYDGRISGAHPLGPHAEETVNLFAMAMRMPASEFEPMLVACPMHASDVARTMGEVHPAQHDRRWMSLEKVCAASFSPSTIVRYGNNSLARSGTVICARIASAAAWISSPASAATA